MSPTQRRVALDRIGRWPLDRCMIAATCLSILLAIWQGEHELVVAAVLVVGMLAFGCARSVAVQ